MSNCPIVLDLGTGFVKAGLSTNALPDAMVANAVGRPILRSDESFSKTKLKDVMVCDEIDPVRQYLDITLPVEHGVVKNWEDESLVLDYIFKEKLRVNNADHPVLITEAPLNPLENRKKMCEIFFEKFGFPGIQVAPQALLVLYAQGLVTGIVVDSGDGVTHIMPIAENYLLPQIVGRMNIAGRDITEQLIKLLTLRGYSFHKSSDFDVVRQMKEKLCFISANIDVDRRLASETTTYVVPYALPDGRVVKISGERFEAGEVLFHPDILGLEEKGLSDLLFGTIMKADINLRKTLFQSIVVSGGTTMFPGLSTRLQNDLQNLVLKNVLGDDKARMKSFKINIEDPPNRRFLVYQGATVLANLTQGKVEPWAHKEEYHEVGADAIIRKWSSMTN